MLPRLFGSTPARRVFRATRKGGVDSIAHAIGRLFVLSERRQISGSRSMVVEIGLGIHSSFASLLVLALRPPPLAGVRVGAIFGSFSTSPHPFPPSHTSTLSIPISAQDSNALCSVVCDMRTHEFLVSGETRTHGRPCPDLSSRLIEHSTKPNISANGRETRSSSHMV
jgi:hypothetical protein